MRDPSTLKAQFLALFVLLSVGIEALISQKSFSTTFSFRRPTGRHYLFTFNVLFIIFCVGVFCRPTFATFYLFKPLAVFSFKYHSFNDTRHTPMATFIQSSFLFLITFILFSALQVKQSTR